MARQQEIQRRGKTPSCRATSGISAAFLRVLYAAQANLRIRKHTLENEESKNQIGKSGKNFIPHFVGNSLCPKISICGTSHSIWEATFSGH